MWLDINDVVVRDLSIINSLARHAVYQTLIENYSGWVVAWCFPLTFNIRLNLVASLIVTASRHPRMATNGTNVDTERNTVGPMASNSDKAKDGRKRVLVVGAGAAGYVPLALILPHKRDI